MSVTIHPTEQLKFHRPLTRTVKESLIVTNTNPFPIVFKVKTTAPKQYCVRPNAGRVEANSEIEVQIILQPFKEEPSEDYKCKDKFLVQTAPIPEAAAQEDIATMWSHIETVEKATMHQHKIKCVFGNSENEDAEQSGNNVREISQAPSITVAANSIDGTSALPANNAMAGAPNEHLMYEQQQQQHMPIMDTATPISPRETGPVNAPSASTETNGFLNEHNGQNNHNHSNDLSNSMESAASMNSAIGSTTLPAAAAAFADNTHTAHSATGDTSGNIGDRKFDVSASFIPSTAATNAAPLAVAGASSNNPFAASVNRGLDGQPQATLTTDKDRGVTHNVDKEKELKDAYSRIAELERQLNEIKLATDNEGLRARSAVQQQQFGNKKLAPTVQPLDAVHQHLADLEKPQSTEGYPPQVVLGVAALVFIFTYLFF